MRSFPINSRPTQTEPGDDLDILQILSTLRRGKWTILFWAAVAVAIGGYYAYRMTTPVYTASGKVAMQSRSEAVVDLATPLSGLNGDYYTINTEVQVLTSRELVTKLVDKLDLVEDPVFNWRLRPKDTSWSVGSLIGLVRNQIIPPPPPGPPPSAEAIRQGVISSVMGALSVSTDNSSYVFDVRATTTDPEASARLANGLLDVYIEDQIATKYEATEHATLWLNERVATLKNELETAENAVKEFAAESDLISPEMLEALNRQVKTRRDRVIEAQAESQTSRDRFAEIEAARTAPDRAAAAAALGDNMLSRVVSDDAAFEARLDRLAQEARFAAEQAGSRAEALEQSLADLEREVEKQSAELVKLQQLQREAAASRQIYEYFLNRLKEISVQQGIHRPDSRILSRATVPGAPSAPNKQLILMASLLLGLVIGAVLVLVREMRHSGFRSAQDLEGAAGLTVMAQIPRAPVSQRRKLLSYLIRKPTSALAEKIRNLRTSVMLSNIDRPPQVIMMTSSLPSEGKTTLSLSLAHSLSGLEKRVLLIEGDIRRRTFREYFRTKGQAGLVSVVSGDVALEEAVFQPEGVGFDVLLGEKTPLNAADFFSSQRFRAFVETLRERYDTIIIDTPPILVVPDARVIGQFADAIVYAVRWNETTQVQVQEGLGMLASVDLKVAGLVLSQIDIRQAQSYGGRYGDLYAGYSAKYYRN